MSRTTVSCLEHLLATCLGLSHGQRNGGRPAIDLQKQVLITIWVLRNPECLRSVADRLNITKSILFRVYRRICGAIANNLSGQYMKYLFVLNGAPLGKMINFGYFAQRNALDQRSNDPSLDHADQASVTERSLPWNFELSSRLASLSFLFYQDIRLQEK